MADFAGIRGAVRGLPPLALLVLALGLPAAAGNPKPKARSAVVSLRGGTLERFEGGAWKDLKAGQAVRVGERLRTGKGAVAVVEVASVGRFVLGPEAEMELGRQPKDFTSKLTRGALWMQAELPKGGRAAVSTPIAIAGIRGTAFSMVYGEGEKAVCACTCTGAVDVTTPDGKAVGVPRGQYVAVGAGESVPAAPQPSAPVLEKSGTVFDFCQTCHVTGGKGTLKPDWKE